MQSSQNTPITICGIPALTGTYDNYIWVLYKADNLNAGAWVVDPGESQAVLDFLQAKDLALNGILITHRHGDHINGVAALKEAFPNAAILGPAKSPLAFIEQPLQEGDEIALFNDYALKVLDTPGHTEDHISFYNEHDLFCGDTLFSAGCGRILGGTPQEFAQSIEKLRNLPDNLNFYCAHEYTTDNLAFAVLMDADNQALQQRQQTFKTDYPNCVQTTALATLGDEKRTNPFMRFDQEPLKQKLLAAGAQASPAGLFAKLRAIKDHFDKTGQINDAGS